MDIPAHDLLEERVRELREVMEKLPKHRHASEACDGCRIGSWVRLVNGELVHRNGERCTTRDDE